MTWKYNFIMPCIQVYRNIAISRVPFCDQQRSRKSQHFLEVDPDAPEVTKLLEEMRSLLAGNKELSAMVEALQLQLSQSKSQNPNKLAEKIGIVIQSGGKSDIETFNM